MDAAGCPNSHLFHYDDQSAQKVESKNACVIDYIQISIMISCSNLVSIERGTCILAQTPGDEKKSLHHLYLSLLSFTSFHGMS